MTGLQPGREVPCLAPVNIRQSPLKLLGLLLAALTMTAASAWMLSLDAAEIAASSARLRSPTLVYAIALAGLLLFGAASLAVPVALWRGRHGLRLDSRGIHNHTWGLLPWGDIHSVSLRDSAGQRFLAIDLHQPQRYLTSAGPFRRYGRRMNHKHTGSPLVLSSKTLQIRLPALKALIERHHAHYASLSVDAD